MLLERDEVSVDVPNGLRKVGFGSTAVEDRDLMALVGEPATRTPMGWPGAPLFVCCAIAFTSTFAAQTMTAVPATDQKPPTSKPGTSQAVSATIPMLIRNRKRPSVTMISRQLTTVRIGLMIRLTTQRIAVAIRRSEKSS